MSRESVVRLSCPSNEIVVKQYVVRTELRGVQRDHASDIAVSAELSLGRPADHDGSTATSRDAGVPLLQQVVMIRDIGLPLRDLERRLRDVGRCLSALGSELLAWALNLDKAVLLTWVFDEKVRFHVRFSERAIARRVVESGVGFDLAVDVEQDGVVLEKRLEDLLRPTRLRVEQLCKRGDCTAESRQPVGELISQDGSRISRRDAQVSAAFRRRGERVREVSSQIHMHSGPYGATVPSCPINVWRQLEVMEEPPIGRVS